ncbi:pentapeptide repeat-containing protein [Mycolicibacterium sphagni]|uniref:pentapeptide repeat-containing protein n=1 Tax=Mycolicibacterium sphagni TaxID=1786 RepID=UPI003D2FCE96
MRAQLSFADLRGAELWSTDFSGANLWRANLSGLELKWLNLTVRTSKGSHTTVRPCGLTTLIHRPRATCTTGSNSTRSHTRPSTSPRCRPPPPQAAFFSRTGIRVPLYS